ncbi:MAG: hypothetical protein MUF84_13600 [Anaerolineae bacterium]|jgi:hypothetical protein|nr:hypothetical protein [Anaerolineae bacterium]
MQGIDTPNDCEPETPPCTWRGALAFGLVAAALVLGLIYLWFAVRNRAVVFLYYHNMGPVVPDTGPFSPVTRSRYWMTGLVAAGAVMVLHTVAQMLLGRLARSYVPPRWYQIWAVAAVPVAIGIPAITTTVNSPRLPLGLAALVLLITLVALALALQPGTLAARRPLDALLLGVDGMGLALWLTALPSLEELPRWIATGRLIWLRWLGVSLVLGLIGCLAGHSLRRLFRRPAPHLGQLVVAALCCGYLALPLAHHTFGTNGYFYISDMDNFFARAPWIQLGAWGLTLTLTWVYHVWSKRRAPAPS